MTIKKISIMINLIYRDEEQDFEWVDVTSPTPADYTELTNTYNLHPASVQDCLAPMHLPKYEKIDNTVFMIARFYDVTAKEDADNIQQLTNKIALFISNKFLITIHRREEPFLSSVIIKWNNGGKDLEDNTPRRLVNQVLYKIIHTYDPAIYTSQEQLDKYEHRIFKGTKNSRLIWELYIVKRRASVFKRMFYLTRDMVDKFSKSSKEADPFTLDLVDNAQSLQFLADELHENVNNLLNLHISLASHRTNEIMGVLTIFSVFFLPPTFIVGLYGMNFDNMPELHYKEGYFFVIFLMLAISLSTYAWFKKKKWL